MLVDVVHLSRWGHLLTAFFCVAVLHAEGEALWRHSAAQREARWRASLALPPLDPSIEGLVLERMTTPLALIDFTNSRGAGMEAVAPGKPGRQGWKLHETHPYLLFLQRWWFTAHATAQGQSVLSLDSDLHLWVDPLIMLRSSAFAGFHLIMQADTNWPVSPN